MNVKRVEVDNVMNQTEANKIFFGKNETSFLYYEKRIIENRYIKVLLNET